MDEMTSEGLSLLWRAIDGLERHAEELAHRDGRECAWEEQFVLAHMARNSLPTKISAEIVTIDFTVPELAAAYRLMREHDGDAVTARHRASDPEVAGALQQVLDLADLLDRQQADPSTRHLLRGWYRRQLLAEVETLLATADRVIGSGELGSLAWETCRQAVENVHERTRAFLHQELPPPTLTLVPSARHTLLGPNDEAVVVLEDAAVAQKVVDLVRVADRRVLVAVPWMRDDELAEAFADACVERVTAGVRVSAVTRPVTFTRGYETSARAEAELHRRLAVGGVELSYNRRVHDKLFVVDDTVVIGSMNLTRSDIRQNHNSAAGFAAAQSVEQCARRVEKLAATGPHEGAVRVAPSELPVFAYCSDGFVHRLGVRGDTDWLLIEGSEQVAWCGDEVTVDSAGRIALALPGERCWDCDREPSGPSAGRPSETLGMTVSSAYPVRPAGSHATTPDGQAH